MFRSHCFSKTKIYKKWASIHTRCKSKKCQYFHRYGGRGIRVCDRWNDFVNFKDDMYESYLKHVDKYGETNTSLDRIDNDGDYCPENCRWATLKEQANNRCTNVFLEFNGERMTIMEWTKKLGVKRDLLYSRRKLGWSTKKILTTFNN